MKAFMRGAVFGSWVGALASIIGGSPDIAQAWALVMIGAAIAGRE